MLRLISISKIFFLSLFLIFVLTYNLRVLGFQNQKANSYIDIEKNHVFSSSEEILIGSIPVIYIDKRDRVFIGDSDQTLVHVFENNGNYLTSLGKQGRGPGDYSAITWRTKITSSNDFIYITDSRFFNTRRANAYNIDDLSFSHVVKLQSDNTNGYEFLKGYAPTNIFPLSDGSFLIPYSLTIKNAVTGTGSVYYIKQDSKGNILSGPLFEQKGPKYLVELVTGEKASVNVMHSFPFHAKPLFALSPSEKYHFAQSDKFEINILDKNWNRVDTILNPFSRQPLSREILIKRYKEINYMPQLGEGIAVKMLEKSEDIPDKWPIFDKMLIDDKDRIWLSTIIEDKTVYRWYILDANGEVITTFNWERNKPIQQIKKGSFYTLEKNKMGEEVVVKYNLRFIQNNFD